MRMYIFKMTKVQPILFEWWQRTALYHTADRIGFWGRGWGCSKEKAHQKRAAKNANLYSTLSMTPYGFTELSACFTDFDLFI